MKMLAASSKRLGAFPGLGRGKLARLQRCVVAVIGCGVLGGGVAYHLAMLGVGLILVDGDVVSPENLANQGFCYHAIGRPKASERARTLRSMNRDCDILAVDANVEALGAAALAGVDLIVSAVDSATVRMRLNDLAIRLGLPLLDGAVDGSGNWLVGNVALFHPTRYDGACYICGLDRRAFNAALAAERRVGCPSWRNLEAPVGGPTLQGSAFASVVSGYQALWAVRALLGDADNLISRRLLISGGGEMASRLLRLGRNRACIHDHCEIGPLHLLAEPTFGGALAAAQATVGGAIERLTFADRSFVVDLECPLCRNRHNTIRVAASMQESELRCSGCLAATMSPLRITNALGTSEFARLADTTWPQLGLAPAEVATAEGGGRRAQLVLNADFSHGPVARWARLAATPPQAPDQAPARGGDV